MQQDTTESFPQNILISDVEKVKYDHLFKVADADKSGSIDGVEARNFFRHSKLPREVLADVWDLADIDRDGQLNLSEFRIAMNLIYWCLQGNRVPSTLPDSLIQSSRLPIGQKPKLQPSLQYFTPPTLVPMPHMGVPYSQGLGSSLRRIGSDSNISQSEISTTIPTSLSLPDISEESDTEEAAGYLKKCYFHLEMGNFEEALKSVQNALNLITKYPHRKKEKEVCETYQLAFKLLLVIKETDDWSEPKYGALFARFLAELSTQPKHRIVSMRMAINRNLQVQNYGVAARFIRELQPLNLMDSKTLESNLNICQLSFFKDSTLLEYTCRTCKKQFPIAGLICKFCMSSVDVNFFVSEFITGILLTVQS